MIIAFWVAVIVYLVGWLLTAFWGYMDWNSYHDYESRYEVLQEEYRARAQAGARLFRMSWIWPLLVASQVKKIMTYTGEDSR